MTGIRGHSVASAFSASSPCPGTQLVFPPGLLLLRHSFAAKQPRDDSEYRGVPRPVTPGVYLPLSASPPSARAVRIGVGHKRLHARQQLRQIMIGLDEEGVDPEFFCPVD